MLLNALLDVILLLPKALFSIFGLLPTVSVVFGEYFAKFCGWGCYVFGSSSISALFISLFAWGTIYAVLGIFAFIRTYVPLVG